MLRHTWHYAFALLSVIQTFIAFLAPDAVLAQAKTPMALATAPADHLFVTGAGLDLRSGRYDYSHVDLKVGASGATAMELRRLPRGGVWGHIEPFGNFTHNLNMMIAEKRVNIETGLYLHGQGPDYRMVVKFGANARAFDGLRTGPFFEVISNNGLAKLTYTGAAADASAVYTYAETDGTVVVFRPMGSNDCSTTIRCAYVSHVVYTDGTRLDFQYETGSPGSTQTSRLRRVTSNRGYAVLFEYAGPNWYTVSKSCAYNLAANAAPTSNVCNTTAVATSSYTYVTSPETLLSAVTDASNAVWSFQHGTAGKGRRTIGFLKPGATVPWLVNTYIISYGVPFSSQVQDGASDFVFQQNLSDGRSFLSDYQDAAQLTANQVRQLTPGDLIDNEGDIVEIRYGFPLFPKSLIPEYTYVPIDVVPGITGDNLPGDGNAATYTRYQITPGPISVKDQLGRITTYEYCDPRIAEELAPSEVDRCVVTPLRAFTDPEGIRTELVRDVCDNVTQVKRMAKPGSGLVDLVTTSVYRCLESKYANKPVSLTDPLGKTTNWSYSSEHGGVLTESLPANNNGVRAVKRYAYAQRTAWVVAPSGGYQALPPVWLLMTEKTCRTSATVGDSCSAGGADEVTTSYDYGPNQGPNNLWLRGMAVTADGQTLRTCYGYDATGNKISETTARASLGVCP